ncbi:hypothetical protein LOAG_05797 [Loa loa]|uniref:Uncharacterized protein n=1 Tax=Loa loa TaxID=7209 RepID=A0A1S0TZ53_LOALO|nr:hypothetical protein LOAG_05797 [Loa loa]EFO22692.1 hypothetical protein LOAG_05797 [Loa loa]
MLGVEELLPFDRRGRHHRQKAAPGRETWHDIPIVPRSAIKLFRSHCQRLW